jgi:hypothetical protein
MLALALTCRAAIVTIEAFIAQHGIRRISGRHEQLPSGTLHGVFTHIRRKKTIKYLFRYGWLIASLTVRRPYHDKDKVWYKYRVFVHMSLSEVNLSIFTFWSNTDHGNNGDEPYFAQYKDTKTDSCYECSLEYVRKHIREWVYTCTGCRLIRYYGTNLNTRTSVEAYPDVFKAICSFAAAPRLLTITPEENGKQV